MPLALERVYDAGRSLDETARCTVWDRVTAQGWPSHPIPRAWNAVLRAMREARGISQAGCATQLGVSRKTVLRWETGKRVPDTGAEAGLIAYCRERGHLNAADSRRVFDLAGSCSDAARVLALH